VTTVFVQRESSQASPDFGKVIGVYRNLQPGYAEEELPADHPDVVAYVNPVLTADQRGALAVDALDRLWFEVNFDQENRMRAFESKAAITRAQYRDALIARWKQLNP
jgi:hypothetical protein